MILNIGQLLDDAKLIRDTITDLKPLEYIGEPIDSDTASANKSLEAIDRIIAYFEERYVPPSEPGSYKDARGIIEWKEGDEPAEDSIRRIRGG